MSSPSLPESSCLVCDDCNIELDSKDWNLGICQDCIEKRTEKLFEQHPPREDFGFSPFQLTNSFPTNHQELMRLKDRWNLVKQGISTGKSLCAVQSKEDPSSSSTPLEKSTTNLQDQKQQDPIVTKRIHELKEQISALENGHFVDPPKLTGTWSERLLANGISMPSPPAFMSAAIGGRKRFKPSLKEIAKDHMRPMAMERTVFVFWGRTGTGKSKRAWEEAGMDAYSKDPRTKFWDGYRGERKVVIDEFRGSIDIAHILRWFDRYPVCVETKGSGYPLCAETIWITSNLPPWMWYPELDAGTRDALERRLIVTEFE